MFNGIESSYDSDNFEEENIVSEPKETLSKASQLGPKNPNWEEDFKKAVRREFRERFNPYDLGDHNAALEYYKKHQHLF